MSSAAAINTTQPTHRRAAAQAAVALAASLVCSHASAWTQTRITDSFQASEATVHSATSAGTLRLDFPYQGKNKATMSVVMRSDSEAFVMLSIERGQFHCPIDYCALQIKFADQPPRNFVVRHGSAGEFNTLVFSYPPAVVEELTTHPRFTIRAEVYRHGLQDMTFTNSAPLAVDAAKLAR